MDKWRVLALSLWALPIMALLPLGVLWLQAHEGLWIWLGALATCSALGYGLQYGLVWRDRRFFTQPHTVKDPNWSLSAKKAWQTVEELAENVQPKDWPLEQLPTLGQKTLTVVATHYHPDAQQPLLALTLPHALLIIEQASADLRALVLKQVPFSHRLTLGTLITLSRWKGTLEKLSDIYRVGRLILNPAAAVMQEVKGAVVGQTLETAGAEIYCWLLREYVRKVGFYAVALYGGELTLEGYQSPQKILENSKKEGEQQEAGQSEPLRIIVMGGPKSGKASLIQALFGTALVPAGPAVQKIPLNTQAHLLNRDGLTAALILDTPSFLEPPQEKTLTAQVTDAGLFILVCRATQMDRDMDRQYLEAVRAIEAKQTNRPPSPIVVAVTHIDQVKPAHQWQPPYDLSRPRVSVKAANIRAAVEAIAADLALPVDVVVPVCVGTERVYNVEEALWAAVVLQKKAPDRKRYLRCLEARKRSEHWEKLKEELVNTGKLLTGKPS